MTTPDKQTDITADTGDLTIGRDLLLDGRPVRVASVLVNVEDRTGRTLTVLPEQLAASSGHRSDVAQSRHTPQDLTPRTVPETVNAQSETARAIDTGDPARDLDASIRSALDDMRKVIDQYR